jgi:hypothetical protein
MKPLLALAAALNFATLAYAGPLARASHEANLCCWEAQFRQGTVGCGPVGPTRGTVLHAEGKHPRLKARMQSSIWKGKNFHGDGTFTNRWLGGIHAITADIRVESSWLDGQPCLVMQYAPNAPVFGNVRDELRQIAPNVWLGHSYDAATGEAKNWFMLKGK